MVRGRLTFLPPLPGDDRTAAYAINDLGQIVGASWKEIDYAGDEREHAVIWDHGTVRDLGVPRGARATRAVALNDRGQVVGSLSTDRTSFDPSGAVLWDGRRTVRLGADTVEPTAINDSGEVVGTDVEDGAFFWDGGKLLHFRPGRQEHVADVDINDAGQVAVLFEGRADESERAFLWDDGTRRPVRLPSAFGGDAIWVNDTGQVLVSGFDAWVLWQDGRRVGTGGTAGTGFNEEGQVAIADDDGIAAVSGMGGQRNWSRAAETKGRSR